MSPYISILGFNLQAYPLLLLLAINLGIGQLFTIPLDGPSALITLLHAITLGILTSFWGLGPLAYLALGTGLLALVQLLSWQNIGSLTWPVAWAALAAAYGLVGYGLRQWRPEINAFWAWAGVWERPFYRSGWIISIG